MSLGLLVVLLAPIAGDRPTFRGVNASGVAEEAHLPVEFGPDQNLVWKTPLPSGHSSPSVGGDRRFVTSVDNGKLLTIALDRHTGRILWTDTDRRF